MICFDSKRTIDIILNNISDLNKKWGHRKDDIFLKLNEQNKEHFFKEKDHQIIWKETEESCNKKLNVLFAHFSLSKYEMEAIEMPLYASKYFNNKDTNIDICYFDSRGNITQDRSKVYVQSAKSGKKTIPKTDKEFLKSYDLLITRSSTLKRLSSSLPEVYNACDYKVNIQTNNHIDCIGIGEDYAFCYTDFFAPAGRKFLNGANAILEKPNFHKFNIVVIVGSVVWWKGQKEWINNIDPLLLKDYIVLILGPVKYQNYFVDLLNEAKKKNIDLLYSDYVHPDFLCDVLCFSKISVMNPFMEPPHQLALGPARTVGESIACRNICIHGWANDPVNGRKSNGKNISIPSEWKDFVIMYDNENNQNSSYFYNQALEKAKQLNYKNINFENQITVEEKSDQIFKKCIGLLNDKK